MRAPTPTAPPQIHYLGDESRVRRKLLFRKLGLDALLIAGALWVLWAFLFVGTITFRFDNLILRRNLGNGYLLNFEFEHQSGILLTGDGSVPMPGMQESHRLIGLTCTDVLIAGEVRVRSGGASQWFLLDKASHSVEWFESGPALQARWLEHRGAPMPPIRNAAALRPAWGMAIVGGGVIAFLLATALSVAGVVLLIKGTRRAW